MLVQSGGINICVVTFFQSLDSRDMVIMVMCDQDMGQFPVAFRKRSLNGPGIARINTRRHSRFRIMQQNTEII